MPAFTGFRQREHLPWQFPSTQWCCSVWLDFLLLTYVAMQLAGARWTHLSWTVYLQTAKAENFVLLCWRQLAFDSRKNIATSSVY